MINKLEKLIRYHRQNVFNDNNGDNHHRAIVRLKQTKTWKIMIQDRQDQASYRQYKRLAGM